MEHEKKLKQFVIDIFEAADFGATDFGDLGGDDLQCIAEKHGILVKVTRHKPCRESCACSESCYPEEWEEGVECFQFADWLELSTNYQRPELNEDDKKKAAADVTKLMRQYGMGNVPKIIGALALENIRLVKEINEHRAARGIEPLPTFEV